MKNFKIINMSIQLDCIHEIADFLKHNNEENFKITISDRKEKYHFIQKELDRFKYDKLVKKK